MFAISPLLIAGLAPPFPAPPIRRKDTVLDIMDKVEMHRALDKLAKIDQDHIYAVFWDEQEDLEPLRTKRILEALRAEMTQ